MIDFASSSPLPIRAGDEIQIMSDIKNHDIVCFERLSEGIIGIKSISKDVAASYPSATYQVEKGHVPGTIALKLFTSEDEGVPTASDYKRALSTLHDDIHDNYIGMLKAHYLAKNHSISATKLAHAVGYKTYNPANIHYGKLAGKIGEELHFYPDIVTEVLATAGEKSADEAHWQWKMRPQLVQALDELGWFVDDLVSDPIMDVEAHEESLVGLEETERETIVQSRVGQGKFRQKLIDYWHKCAVTDCRDHSLLKASHIKPWRNSTNKERLDHYNGLLLSPNLDAVFDLGLISFDDEGKIMLSPRLHNRTAASLGIHAEMKISFIAPEQKPYLNYHRENIFKKSY